MYDAIRRMQEQQEMIRRLAEGPVAEFLRNHDALARSVAASRSLEVERLATLTTSLTVPDSLRQIVAAQPPLSELLAQFQTPSFITAVEQARQHMEDTAARRFLVAHQSVAEQMAAMTRPIDAALRAMATIEVTRIGALAATDSHNAFLGRLTDRLFLRHTTLIAAFGNDPGLVGTLPPDVAALPTMDLFVHTSAVRAFAPHESMGDEDDDDDDSVSLRVEIGDETVIFLEQTLPILKPAFLEQYRGAKARVDDKGPDWWTQGSASLRKLLKGVLHTAAPSEAVTPWAQKHKKAFDANGHPTRETKVEWLCEFIPCSAYRAYVRTELSSAMALIKIVDSAQHVDDFPEFEQQYAWVMLRTEVAIRHILELWRTRDGH